jgi:hypothetical protein
MVARAGTPIAVREQFGGHGRAVITASSAMEYAFEGLNLADSATTVGPSVFTKALVEGLDTGDADRDQDGYVGLDELYDYVYEHVQRATPNQTPGKWTFDLQGELRVARRARPVTAPAQLPPELHEAIEHPLSGMRAGAVGELTRLLNGGHAGLALAARIALERLAEDDSRTVGRAAATALGLPTQPTSAEPTSVPPLSPPAESPSASQAAPTPVIPTVPIPREAGATQRTRHTTDGATTPATADDRAADPAAPTAPGVQKPPRTVLPRPARAALPVLVRVLAAIAAFGLAYEYSGTHRFVTDRDVFTKVGFLVPPWLWLLAGSAVVVTIARRNRRERDIAMALAIGLAGGVLAVFGAMLDVVSSSSFQAEFQRTMWAALAALLAAMIDLIPADTVVQTIINAVSVAAVLTALLPLVFLSDDDLQPFSLRTWICLIVLAAGTVTVWVRRWRRDPRHRRTLGLGALSTVLVVFDCLSSVSEHSNLFNLVFFPALPIMLAVSIVIDEHRAVPLAIARLSLIAGLLVLDAPIYTDTPPGLIPVSAHPLVEIAAACCALAACYTVVDRRSRSTR